MKLYAFFAAAGAALAFFFDPQSGRGAGTWPGTDGELRPPEGRRLPEPWPPRPTESR